MSSEEHDGLIVQVSQDGGWSLPEALLEAGIRHVVAREGVLEGEISLTFLGDEGITELNRQYLGREAPTDVIAFALHDPGFPILGDVYVGYEQARRQAEELEVALREELLRLAIHGTLHVLGYDHPEGPERFRSPMYRIQEGIVEELLRAEPSA